MKATFLFPIGLSLLLLVSITGCERQQADPTSPSELVSTTPEAVLVELTKSLIRKDPASFQELLAPEFVLELQPQDPNNTALEFQWGDEPGPSCWFGALSESDLFSTLEVLGSESAAGPERTSAAWRIRAAALQGVDQSGGMTLYFYGMLHDLLLRPGDRDRGEDSSRWFLTEWRIIPTDGGSNHPGVQNLLDSLRRCSGTELPEGTGEPEDR